MNLTVQAIETTPGEPTRIIQTTFRVPIIADRTIPSVTFNQSSIPNDTQPNATIGKLTVHNVSTPYRLVLLDSYDGGLELDPKTNLVTLKRPLSTFPLINNRTQLPITVALINEKNETILNSTFPIRITYSVTIDPCLNKDCGNGQCFSRNDRYSLVRTEEHFDRSLDFASVYPTVSVRVATEVKIVDNGTCAFRTRAQTRASAINQRPPMVSHVNVHRTIPVLVVKLPSTVAN